MRLSDVAVIVAFAVVLCVCIYVFVEVSVVYKALIDSLFNVEGSNPYEQPELFVAQGFVLLALMILVIAVALMLAVVATLIRGFYIR